MTQNNPTTRDKRNKSKPTALRWLLPKNKKPHAVRRQHI